MLIFIVENEPKRPSVLWKPYAASGTRIMRAPVEQNVLEIEYKPPEDKEEEPVDYDDFEKDLVDEENISRPLVTKSKLAGSSPHVTRWFFQWCSMTKYS